VEKHGVLGEISLGRNHRERERERGGGEEGKGEGGRERDFDLFKGIFLRDYETFAHIHQTKHFR